MLRRNHNYYVGNTKNIDDMKNLSLNMNNGYHYIQNVMNVNKRLKKNLNMMHMYHILSMCITALSGKESRFNKYQCPISISTGSITCTIEPEHFIICDKNDPNTNNVLIMIDDQAITNTIEDVINLRNSKKFTGSVNDLFNHLKILLTDFCPVKGRCHLVIVGCDDNCVYFKWTNEQTIEMYVDIDRGFSIINVVTVKKNSGGNVIIFFVIMYLLFILCALCVQIYDSNRKLKHWRT